MGTWKSVGQVEWETLKWVNWYNTKRLHSKIGYFTPQEAEEKFYEALNAAEKAALYLNQQLSGKPGTCVDASCLASIIFDLSAGSSIGRVSGL